MKQEINTEV